VIELSQEQTVRQVELSLCSVDGGACGMLRAAGVSAHLFDAVPVDADDVARRTGFGCIAAAITPALLQFVEAVIVGDLLALGMKWIAVAVPYLRVIGAFALLHDLLERRERSGRVFDRRDEPSVATEQPPSHLLFAITAEDRRLPEARAKFAQTGFDRF